ncbi:MAG TPA: VOC family protein, partial [Actinospica sp.]|nr:VOC family protein [Actinospica sp.]
MATANQVSPILPVRDLAAALDFYRRLGFTVRAYHGGGYAFALRDDVEIHLGEAAHDHHPAS